MSITFRPRYSTKSLTDKATDESPSINTHNLDHHPCHVSEWSQICSQMFQYSLRINKMLDLNAGIYLHAGQVAHCHFIFACVLYNFGTQVATLDCTKILLIALTIRRVLVQHVGSARLDLRIKNSSP